MDYYESSRPPVDDSGLTGGVGFNFNGQIATQSFRGSTIGSNYASQQGGGGGGATTMPIQICVDGVTQTINVYVAE